MTTPYRERTDHEWVRAPAVGAGVFAALVFAVVGVLAARLDIALLAVPLAVGLAWSWDRRPGPDHPSTVTATLADDPDSTDSTDGADGTPVLDYTISVQPPRGVDAVVLTVATLASDSRRVVVGPAAAGALTGRVPLLHSGPQELVRVDYSLLGPDALWSSPTNGRLAVRRVVRPAYRAIEQLPLPRRLAALTGPHESARTGDGGEFRDVHPFTPGDRLRRIDWKTTARRAQHTGELYVRRMSAVADATVLIVMDSRDDVGEQVAQWRTNTAAVKGLSALDVAREAASAIAAGYIRAGDRVGFQDLSSRRRMIPHGSGDRHLWRLLRAIEIAAPSAEPFARRRPPIVPPGALVFVLSSFLDDQAVGLAAQWQAHGHRVIAVDILPAPRFAGARRAVRLAHRVVMMERADRLRLLSARGVELLRWPDDAGGLPREGRLRTLARAPRRRR